MINYLKSSAVLIILILGLGHLASAQMGPPKSPVRVSPVIEREINQPVSFIGTVEPRMKSLVASEIRGLVEKFPAKEGDTVKKGQLLAQIRVTSLEIQLKAARASLLEVKARHEQAKRDLIRSERLFSEEVIPSKRLEDDRSQEKALSERVQQLTAEIERLEDQISKSRIVAPFGGVITKERTEVGQWLQEGSPVVEMVDLGHVQVRVDVPERYIGKLRVGEGVSVSFDALPAYQGEGKILAIIPDADRAARAFPIKVDVDNKDHIIKSGMTARVSFLLGEPHPAKLIPKDALVTRGGGFFVYVVDGDAVREEEVHLGNAVENLMEITGKIEVGERVVVRGNERLRPGQLVQVIE